MAIVPGPCSFELTSEPDERGKLTLGRIIEAVVGPDNCSAEELYDLSVNRFRAAELYAKVMNVASDIRADRLADVATFKKATGGDDISAERKFGDPFKFRFDGLFVWTMNLVPTVGEAAAAHTWPECGPIASRARSSVGKTRRSRRRSWPPSCRASSCASWKGYAGSTPARATS
jgi:hypothetical protein